MMLFSRKVKLLLLAVLGGVISACSETEELPEKGRIAFHADNAFTAITRSVSIQSFGVSASVYAAGNSFASAGCGSFFYNEEVSAATGATKHYWPGKDFSCSFFAYYPYGNSLLTLSSASTDLGKPVYSLETPLAVSKQVDFMTAEVLDHEGIASEAVPLTFFHRCAAVRYSFYNQSASTITIHSIHMADVKRNGVLQEDLWTVSGDAVSMENPMSLTVNLPVEGNEQLELSEDNQTLKLIPQTIPQSASFLKIIYTANGESKESILALTFDLELTEGKLYNLAITLGDYEPLVIDITNIQVADWVITANVPPPPENTDAGIGGTIDGWKDGGSIDSNDTDVSNGVNDWVENSK